MIKSFDLFQPKSLDEALQFLSEMASNNRKVHLLAGGTDLVPTLRAGNIEARNILDLAGVGLDKISVSDTEMRIGALVTLKRLSTNKDIKNGLPVLAEAVDSVGAVQTRNLATIGGNLCSAVPSADLAPALFVLDAKLHIVARNRERIVPAEEFFLGPRRTVLEPDEILDTVIIPLKGYNFQASFMKTGRRKALTLAIVNCAVGFELKKNGEILNSRIALGAVAPTPIRAYSAEKALQCKIPSEELFVETAKIAASETKPISDIRASAEYRRVLSEVMVRRSLHAVWQKLTAQGGDDLDQNSTV